MKRMTPGAAGWLTSLVFLLAGWISATSALAAEMPRIRVSGDRHSFVEELTNAPFIPRGFNYDHDEKGRLIEDYWETEWDKVVSDFAEMRQLGANLVRVHLQMGRFLNGPDQANPKALSRLALLVELAQANGLYLDLTGLGCYHKADVPPWYDALSEEARWNAQARFWEEVARICAANPAIFCYDLMNEPVVPGGDRQPGDWLGPAFAGKHFVQFITLSAKERPRPDIARAWIARLKRSIRQHDPKTMITVGLVDWSLDRPGLTSGFVPKKIAEELDFVSVHLYPRSGKIDEALETLAGFAVGKPVLIEETFPLQCTPPELERFLDESRSSAAGWVGFYWGKTPQEYRGSKEIADALMSQWLELFVRKAKQGPSP
jgi:Cellulase (glycosyl hydrolase family 5)